MTPAFHLKTILFLGDCQVKVCIFLTSLSWERLVREYPSKLEQRVMNHLQWRQIILAGVQDALFWILNLFWEPLLIPT